MLVTSFNQACKEKGLNPKTVLPDVSAYPKEHQKAVIAHAKLLIIIDVLNDGYKFNWDDYSEQKWELWWYMNKPGFRLGGALCVRSASDVGSRLCFRTKALALHAAKHFEPLFKDYYVQ